MFKQSTTVDGGDQTSITSNQRITPPNSNTTEQDEYIKRLLMRRFIIIAPIFAIVTSPTAQPLLPYEIKILTAVAVIYGVVGTISEYLNYRRQQRFDPEIGDIVDIEIEAKVVDTYHDRYIVNIDGTEVRVESETGENRTEQETP